MPLQAHAQLILGKDSFELGSSLLSLEINWTLTLQSIGKVI
jgi:hypothetical protein